MIENHSKMHILKFPQEIEDKKIKGLRIKLTLKPLILIDEKPLTQH